MLARVVASQLKHNSYFVAGLAIGLWVALVAVPLEDHQEPCAAPVINLNDDFEPQREQRPPPAAGPAHTLQRPRYYTTELGMRGGVFAGILSSEEQVSGVEGRARALNATAQRLQPALRFFMTASGPRATPPLANVVGFTDLREMLKPFRALKYLADNYLEEYNFFFLATDATFVNARRLQELVSKLSISQDIYMGVPADDGTHYCSLESGILLSNSVVRAVHTELDWCVRNSYSAHHHENIGRCVLHAAHVRCSAAAQGEGYGALQVPPGADGEPLGDDEALASAVAVAPLASAAHFHRLRARTARVLLQRASRAVLRERAALRPLLRRLPEGFRNASWPPGLRHDPALDAPSPPPRPASRFDHLRWTWFNDTHMLMPDDHRSVAPHSRAHNKAIKMVLESAAAWCEVRWGSRVSLVEGALRWEQPLGLRYRLLLRATGDATGDAAAPPPTHQGGLRLVEGMRPLGAARLVPVPYVTESARVSLLLPASLAPHAAQATRRDALAFLRRYKARVAQRDDNTALVLVLLLPPVGEDRALVHELREAVAALQRADRALVVESRVALPEEASDASLASLQARAALEASIPRVSRDALLLTMVAHGEYNDEFLNRVRMNTIAGEQWFLPAAFARYAQYAHPRFVDADGAKPQVNTGRFALQSGAVVAVHRADYEAARARAREPNATLSLAALLARSPLRCVQAPEPALLLAPRGAPCVRSSPAGGAACLRATRDEGFAALGLGARHTLAKLVLETQQ